MGPVCPCYSLCVFHSLHKLYFILKMFSQTLEWVSVTFAYCLEKRNGLIYFNACQGSEREIKVVEVWRESRAVTRTCDGFYFEKPICTFLPNLPQHTWCFKTCINPKSIWHQLYVCKSWVSLQLSPVLNDHTNENQMNYYVLSDEYFKGATVVKNLIK